MFHRIESNLRELAVRTSMILSTSIRISLCTLVAVSPFSRSSFITDRKYVFGRPKALEVRSGSGVTVVIRRVAKI